MSELTISTGKLLDADQFNFICESINRSFKVDDITQGDGALHITLPDAEADMQPLLKKTVSRLLFAAKSMNKDLLFENKTTITYEKDPQPDLEATRDVIPVHPGFFTFQGDFLRVFHALNSKVRQFAHSLDAIEQEYPAVWPVRLFKKIDYFREFPQQVIMCAPVKDDYASRDAFAKKYAKSEDYEKVEMNELMADSEYGLEPAVCDCCYYGLENQQNLSDAYYTCYNKVFRNERSKSLQLDRLTNFSVRDIMFVGSENFVLECRQTLIEILSEFLSSLQLTAKIGSANDPFFANESAMKSVFQNSHRLKYELLVWIPHLEKEISCGSINYHMEFFGSAFNIGLPDEKPAYSGCIGVGMERTTYALFCQHGSSLQQWPASLKKYLGLG